MTNKVNFLHPALNIFYNSVVWKTWSSGTYVYKLYM